MGTPAQNKANRENAKRSTGPKTDEGKAKSARNAMKHGMTAKKYLLEDECPEQFRAMMTDWHVEFAGAGPAERVLIEEAVASTYQLRRARRSEAAAANRRMRKARIVELAEERKRVEELGRRLRKDVINRCAFYRRDPRTLDAMDDWLENDDPPVIVAELETTRGGVAWMQAQWEELGTTLEREGYWHYNEKFFAIRLLGRRQIDVYEQFGIAMIYAACNVAHVQGWDIVHDSIQSNLGAVDRPTYYQRIDSLRRFFPESKAEAAAMLRRVVDGELARLARLRRVLDPIHDADGLDAPQAAILDESPHAVRYMNAARGSLYKSLGLLFKIFPGRRASLGPGYEAPDDPLLEAPEPEPEPEAEADPGPESEPEPHVLDALRDHGMALWRLDPTPYNPIEPRDDLATRREDMDPSDPRYYGRWRPESEASAQQYLPPGHAAPRNEPDPPPRPEVADGPTPSSRPPSRA